MPSEQKNLKKIFNRKDLLSINWDEIIFDLLLILYSEFFLYRIISQDKMLLQLMNIDLLMITGVLIDFFVIWYLGMIFSRFKRNTENYILLAIILIVSLWIVFSLHFGIAHNIGDIYPNDIFINIAIYGLLLVMGGIGCGLVFAISEVQAIDHKKLTVSRIRSMKIMLTFGFTSVNIYFAYLIVKALGAGGFLLGIILWMFLTASVYIFFSFLEKKAMKREGGGYRFSSILKKLFFPVIIATILCLWDEIYLWGRISPALRTQGSVSSASIFFYLVFTGIIPMRVLMAFQPPVSIVSIITGIISITYFIISVNQLINSIFM